MEACERYDIKINCDKTKTLFLSENGEIHHRFRVYNENLEIVNKATYLECSLNKELD